MIKYILDPNQQHGLGTRPLEFFLRLLVIKGDNNSFIKKYFKDLLVKSTKFNVTLVDNEKPHRDARYDIYIQFTINVNESTNIESTIVIENKVLSSENENQTDKYNKLSKEFKNLILVYLVKDDKSKKSQSENFINIIYQDLLDYMIEPMYNYTDNLDTKNILREYMRVLSHIEKEKGYGVTLAMGSEEKELLNKIYNENKNLFNILYEKDPDEQNDLLDGFLIKDKELLERIINVLPKEEKEKILSVIKLGKSNRYKWMFNGELITSVELVTRFIKEQLEKGKSIEDFSHITMHGKSKVVVEEPEEGHVLEHYREIQVKGKTYYVRRCCPVDKVEKLVDEYKIDAKKTEI